MRIFSSGDFSVKLSWQALKNGSKSAPPEVT